MYNSQHEALSSLCKHTRQPVLACASACASMHDSLCKHVHQPVLAYTCTNSLHDALSSLCTSTHGSLCLHAQQPVRACASASGSESHKMAAKAPILLT
eukprot:1146999-Pelagomonas_calceolata.AAC.1